LPTDSNIEYPQKYIAIFIYSAYDAGKAARLCGVPRVAACIIGAEAPDKALEAMLNQLLDNG